MKIKCITFNVQCQVDPINKRFDGDFTDEAFDVIILCVQECLPRMESYERYLTSWAIENAISKKFTYIGKKIVSPPQKRWWWSLPVVAIYAFRRNEYEHEIEFTHTKTVKLDASTNQVAVFASLKIPAIYLQLDIICVNFHEGSDYKNGRKRCTNCFLDKRKKDWETVMNEYSHMSTPGNFCLLMGATNFRVASDLKGRLGNSNFAKFLNADELSNYLKVDGVSRGFHDVQDIHFYPTCSIEYSTKYNNIDYDSGVPAWTDRILIRENANNPENYACFCNKYGVVEHRLFRSPHAAVEAEMVFLDKKTIDDRNNKRQQNSLLIQEAKQNELRMKTEAKESRQKAREDRASKRDAKSNKRVDAKEMENQIKK